MTTETIPDTEPLPWEGDAEWNQPSAVIQAADRVQATMFLRPNTPIETFDRQHPDATVGYRIVGLHVGDLTIQFTANDGDRGVMAATANLRDALTALHDAAAARLAGTPS